MGGHKEDFGWIKPKFGVIAFLKNKLKISSDDFAKKVYQNKAIIAPGRLFGFNDYVRVSYCQPPDKLREALKRIDKTIDEVK
jgi:aspartate/methionine/tyrosine aminotransferase